MRRTQLVAVLLLCLSEVGWGSNYIVPNTTLAAQTANNSSAANGFTNQSNGNLGANNVSKVDIHSLLYSGASTKVFAHLLLWFGQGGHMNVGYNSNDAGQVHSQITDMISRGIDGVIIDWYGPNNSIDQATQLVMNEAEKHPGFTFAIMIDAGAMNQSSCRGCSPQQQLTQLLQYVEQEYFPSSAYFKIDGQPVVTNFNIEYAYSIDWNAVSGAVPVVPRFLFQDGAGFSHPMSDGSFAWVMPQISDYGISYLSGFYDAGMKFGSLETVGAAYKGFNDSLASWGSGRVMNQQCGQTWLQTFSEANNLYNSGRQLPYMQLVTWNDYEEATEIESGIDNCFSLSASASGNSLQWNISGNEDTIDHYNVLISQDEQNLMTLTQTEPGNRSIDLCSFSIPPGNYQLFVQAVGKPNLANRMPDPVNYAPSCPVATTGTTGSGSGSTSSGSLTASPNALIISNGTGEVTVTAAGQSGSNGGSIALSCDYLPANLVCSFSPATITPGSGAATSTLTITASVTAENHLPRRGSSTTYTSLLFSVGVAGFVFIGNKSGRSKLLAVLIACGLAAATMMLSSCGGAGSAAQKAVAANTYTVSVLGSSASSELSTTLTVTIP